MPHRRMSAAAKNAITYDKFIIQLYLHFNYFLMMLMHAMPCHLLAFRIPLPATYGLSEDATYAILIIILFAYFFLLFTAC